MRNAPQRVFADPGELLLPGHLAGLIVEDDQRLSHLEVVRIRRERLLQCRRLRSRHRHGGPVSLAARAVVVDLLLDLGIRAQGLGRDLLAARDREDEDRGAADGYGHALHG